MFIDCLGPPWGAVCSSVHNQGVVGNKSLEVIKDPVMQDTGGHGISFKIYPMVETTEGSPFPNLNLEGVWQTNDPWSHKDRPKALEVLMQLLMRQMVVDCTGARETEGLRGH